MPRTTRWAAQALLSRRRVRCSAEVRLCSLLRGVEISSESRHPITQIPIAICKTSTEMRSKLVLKTQVFKEQKRRLSFLTLRGQAPAKFASHCVAGVQEKSPLGSYLRKDSCEFQDKVLS